MRSIRRAGVGCCLFLSARGWGKEKNCKSLGVCPRERMVRGQIESCINISLSCFSPSPLPLPFLRLPRRLVAYFLFFYVPNLWT